jgi:mono/diheme cytochrome c family protein
MIRSWIFIVLMVGGGFLFLTVVQGQIQPQPNFANSDDVARGKILFTKYCTGCHGPEGEGGEYKFTRGPDPPDLTSPSTEKKFDDDLLKIIHDGKPNMPPWNVRLSERERKDVLAYVRTLAK